MVWWLTCFARAPRPPSFNICVGFYALQVYGWCIIVLSAPIVRLNCAGFWCRVWKLGQSGCAGCVALETSPPLNLHLKGVRRARGVLGDSDTQDPWWCGGTHSPDMGRPTYGSARMVNVG